jgi:hypothetical protein
MAVRMVSLTTGKTGEYVARKAIPADVRAEYKRRHGVSREAILKVSWGTSKAQAKALHGQWLAEFMRVIVAPFATPLSRSYELWRG